MPSPTLPDDTPGDERDGLRLGSAQVVSSWIELCIAAGSDHFFIAPGSRCTPLTLAIADHPKATLVQHFDERGLAFACLGYGRASDKAGVFVCTSGTAVANALPAVIEASLESIPMLLLTADRPPELRDIGANQTIDQVKLFGGYPVWHFDLPCPNEDYSTSFWRATIGHALRECQRGPVHLNCMFREPFEFPTEGNLSTGQALSNSGLAPRDAGSLPQNTLLRNITPPTPPSGKTLIVCGRVSDPAAAAVERLAQYINAPVAFDVTSGRRGVFHDLQLMSPERHPAPDFVLHIGGRYVSKRLLNFVQQSSPSEVWRITESEQRSDPTLNVTRVIRSSIVTACDSIQNSLNASADICDEQRAFAESWWQNSAMASSAAAEVLNSTDELSEPMIAIDLLRTLPTDASVYFGNSMPIRDIDAFAGLPLGEEDDDRTQRWHVFANRGASGIDGQIATACGLIAANQRPAVAVLGDLSALHDLNSLAIARSLPAGLVVVVVNNDGGGIFHFLPVAQRSNHFERLFATPHGLTFHSAAQQFGYEYRHPNTREEFINSLKSAWGTAGEKTSPRSTLIEVTTDRERNMELHGRVRDAVTEALESIQ